MWKIVVAFLAFAALALWVLSKGGDIDMSGEKHGIDSHEPAAHGASAAGAAASMAAPTAAPAAAASAASN
ncbi:MAG: hypothetical protein RL456_1109 [Pseudomonadota bacterium]|jgi:hypothetical protein